MDENQGEKPTQRNIHMGEGDYRNTHLSDQSTYVERQYNYLQTFATKPEKRNRTQQELLHWVGTEVEKRLQQSLHNRVYIILDKEENPEQVQHPWEIDIKVGEELSYQLPKDTSIEQVFDRSDIAGRLLILGAPGSGKTTILLKLAEQLVKRANDNPQYAIPVLLNLSSWKEDQQSIKDWMIADLKLKYGVRKDIAKKWIEEGVILPLLDGLDELSSVRQEKCVEKINEFLHPKTWSRELVVCSRVQEYQHYSTNLELNASIILKPLTTEQIQDYVLKTEGEALWNKIKTDSYLMELAQTPLFLLIIVLSYIDFELWNQFQSDEERRAYLFDAYIQRMLDRRYKDQDKPYKDRDTVFWLKYLAQQLIWENKTEFLIEKMQPTWLRIRGKIIIYSLIWLIGQLISAQIHILIVGLMSWLISGQYKYSLMWQIFSLIMVLMSWLMRFELRLKIRIPETILFSIDLVFRYLKKDIIPGLFLALISWWFLGWFPLLRSVLIVFLISWMILSLFQQLVGAKLETRAIPNQGIRNSLFNIGYLLIITFPIVVVLIIISYLNELRLIRQISFMSAFFILFSLNFFFVSPVMQYFSLRIMLYITDQTPWNYARFLDYSTDRLFLQRVGGGYRFIHDLLRQHFATMRRP